MMKKFNENKLNKNENLKMQERNTQKYPWSMEMYEKYGNINSLKTAIKNNKHGTMGYIDERLKSTIESFQKSKSRTKSHFINFFGPAMVDGIYNLYSYNGEEFVYIDIDNYTNYLLDLVDSFESHLLDLDKMLGKDFNNKEICLVNCYMELKSICSKILYAISCGGVDIMRIEDCVENQNFEDYEEYKEINSLYDYYRKNNLYSDLFYKLFNAYYETICDIGDYIFVYLGKYEKFM